MVTSENVSPILCLPLTLSNGFLTLWSLELAKRLLLFSSCSQQTRVPESTEYRNGKDSSASELLFALSGNDGCSSHPSAASLAWLLWSLLGGLWPSGQEATIVQWQFLPPSWAEVFTLDCQGKGGNDVPIHPSLEKPREVSLDWEPLV